MVRTGVTAALAMALAACSGGENAPEATAGQTAAGAPQAEFRTELNNQELMAHVIDYNAFEIWHRQGWIYSADGVEELFPTDDEGWFAAENAAATLAELSNTLLLPGRVPPDADDAADWISYAHELNRTSIVAMQRAEAQDKEAFFDAGGDIYVVCRSCHEQFVIGDIE